MTKEELKQEAEEKCVCTDEAMRIMYGIGYIDGAEPREKRIAELETRCNELFLQTMQLTKAKELLKRCYEHYIYLEPLRSEIEQFLNEVEKCGQ